MPLYTSIPQKDPKFTQQTEQTQLSMKAFTEVMRVPKHSFLLHVFRILIFIFFLVIPKIIILVPGSILLFITFSFLRMIRIFFKNEKQFLRFCRHVIIFPLRIVLLGLGFTKINFIGKCDPEARLIVSNHISVADPIIVGLSTIVTYIGSSEVSNLWFVRIITDLVSVFFFDRHQTGNKISQVIAQLASNEKYEPILIFPEGETTNGDALLGFRSGAFITDYKIQPVTLTYKCWLMKRGYSTVSWVDMNPFRYFLDLLVIPFISVDLEYLEPVKSKAVDAKKKAKKVQLQMANHLGVPANHPTKY